MPKFDFPPMQPLGPADAKIMFIGEAPGEDEQMQGRPFVGASGVVLRGMCKLAGIEFDKTYRTNVFYKRPVGNQIETFLVPGKQNGIPGLPPLKPGLYADAVHTEELERLYDEIDRVNPNVICCLGNTPLWAVCKVPPKISSSRGRVVYASILGKERKVLPTFHPAYIIRTWKDRPLGILDLIKVRRHAGSPTYVLPRRRVLIDPTISEVEQFFHEYVFRASHVVMDVETAARQITVCGIAVSPELAGVIPFWDDRKPSNSYWDDPRDEATCIKLFRKLLADKSIEKIHQNGMYDQSYYWDNWKANCQGFYHDTMLRSHSTWPELRKGLSDLASIYTEEASWKMMRLKNHDNYEKDE